jgi:hypothetical protein
MYRSTITLILLITVNFLSNYSVAEENITYQGFVDTYLLHNLNNKVREPRPYSTQALYDKEQRINLGTVRANHDGEDWRSRLALQVGDSVKFNYANEKERFWRYFQEANIGYQIADNIWLDGGIYLSHLGFESFNSKENWNYTRSLVAEFSPYYESGAKLSYKMDERNNAQFHLLRGWQNISSPANPFVGLQFQHFASDSLTLSVSNVFGDENGERLFHNFIASLNLSSSWKLALQVDVGQQERENETAWWYGSALLAQYNVNECLRIGSRLEHFTDPHQVIVKSITEENFNGLGGSINIDYDLTSKILWRNEFRHLFSRDAIFPEKDTASTTSNYFVTSLTFSF